MWYVKLLNLPKGSAIATTFTVGFYLHGVINEWTGIAPDQYGGGSGSGNVELIEGVDNILSFTTPKTQGKLIAYFWQEVLVNGVRQQPHLFSEFFTPQDGATYTWDCSYLPGGIGFNLGKITLVTTVPPATPPPTVPGVPVAFSPALFQYGQAKTTEEALAEIPVMAAAGQVLISPSEAAAVSQAISPSEVTPAGTGNQAGAEISPLTVGLLILAAVILWL